MRRGGANLAIAELGRLIQTIERLSEVPRKVAVIAAPKLTRLLQAQFRAGTDPYGRAWAPLKASTLAKGRRPPPLTDKKRLRDGTMAKVARYGIRMVVGAPYGFFHQVGFRNGRTRVPARRILPQTGYPVAWKRVLDDAARQAAREAVR
jgi:phage gpG-like protein